jgi:Na+-driven multidrug efflux pump
MSVKISRVIVWVAIMLIFGETKTLCGRAKEPLLSRIELFMFVRLSVPAILFNFSSWFVFELQIMGLANIAGIRTLTLLGKRDPGASRAFAMLCVMSTSLVALLNVPLLLFPDQVAQAVSNEPEVQQWFSDALWVLVLHSQTRVMSLNAACLFISMGHSTVGVLLNFVCFYCIASPISGVVALTDLVTTSVKWKITACVGTTSIAQTLITVVGYGYLAMMDWDKAGKLIEERANNDLLAQPQMIRRTSSEQMS